MNLSLQFLKSIFILFVFILFTQCTGERETTSVKSSISQNIISKEKYEILYIKDGDTMVILLDGEEEIVRFSHIDCPENDQPYSNEATQLVINLCQEGYVYLQNNEGYDKYGRLLAEIILENGLNINKKLVENGLAWHYKEYSSDEDYARLEQEAKDNKRGLWNQSDPIPPWVWRHQR